MSRSPFQNELTATLKLAGPIMGAQVLNLSMIVVDNLMVARLGASSLASLALASTVHSFFFVFAMGILSSLSVLVSEAHGAGDDARVGPLIRQGMRIAIVLAALIMVIYQYSEPIFLFLGQKPELVPDAVLYLKSLGLGVPALCGYFCFRHFTEATSDSKPTLCVMAVAALLNIPLDYALIHGAWGFPRCGVAGAGFATSFLLWANLIALACYTKMNKRYDAFRFWDGPFHTDWQVIRRILQLGLPISGTMLMEMAFFGTATFLMGRLGTEQLASHQIAINSASFTFMVPVGLSMAVSIRVGRFVGSRDGEGARRAGMAGFTLALIFGALMGLGFLIFARPIAEFYTPDPTLAAAAISLLVIAGFFQIFDGLQVVSLGALRGLKETRVPFLNAVLAFWLIGMPMILFLTFQLDFGPRGIWYGLMIGLGIASLLHLIRFSRQSERMAR